MKNKTIRIALTKGRLENKTVDLLDKIGYDVTELREKGRRLILSIPGEDIEVVLAKAAGRNYIRRARSLRYRRCRQGHHHGARRKVL